MTIVPMEHSHWSPGIFVPLNHVRFLTMWTNNVYNKRSVWILLPLVPVEGHGIAPLRHDNRVVSLLQDGHRAWSSEQPQYPRNTSTSREGMYGRSLVSPTGTSDALH